MAVLEQHKEISTCSDPKLEMLKPPKNEDEDKPSSRHSSRLKQMTKNNVVSANPMKSESHNPKTCKKAEVESLYCKPKAQCSVLERANELAANLAPEFPTLVRVMLPSNVTRTFWLGIPRSFCRDHMPKNDTWIVLEDENGKEFRTKYLAGQEGLRDGWKMFSVDHKLLEGDVVVFHKVMASKFKVYIVRSNDSEKLDCALALNKVDDGIRQIITTEVTACESSKNGKPEAIAVQTMDASIKENTIPCNAKYGPISDQFLNDSEAHYSEALDGMRVSESVIPFKEVSCFENFKVRVGSSIINAEISKHHLIKYYELCHSQNSYLHEHILEGLNSDLVAGLICETVNLSDAIRACNITTSEGLNSDLVAGLICETVNLSDAIRACNITTSECDFSTWDKTLQASEMLGMNVGFLRVRLDKLASLASKAKLHSEARLARDQAVKDLITLEPKLLRAKELRKRINLEIQTLNTTSKKVEATFKEVAQAPW